MDPNAEYWESIGRGWEKDVGSRQRGDPTHFKHWQRLDNTWRHILLSPHATHAEWREAWAAFEREYSDHGSCTPEVRCGACGAGYCKHLQSEHLCLSFPVCTMCDTNCHPNPYNPKCRWLVEYYTGPRGWGGAEGQNLLASLKTPVLGGHDARRPARDNSGDGSDSDSDSDDYDPVLTAVEYYYTERPARDDSDDSILAELVGDLSVDTPVPVPDSTGTSFPKAWGW
jgi:hypothetical protein